MNSTVKQRILSVVMALAALGAAFFGANYWRANYLAGVAMVSLPVPKSDIPPYTLLDGSMFEQSEFPRALINQGTGYAISADDLAGRISAGTLLAGEPVSVRLAASPADFRLADPALEVVSIPLEVVSGVGGHIRNGEQVNLYRLAYTDATETADGIVTPGTAEVTLVARVLVVAVLDGNGQEAMRYEKAQAADQNQLTTNAPQQPQPVKVLVVAAPPQIVQSILDAIARTKLGEELLWVTLALP